MTASDIQHAIVGWKHACMWTPQQVTASFNSSGIVGWEADILVMHKSGWLWEIEVKISVADFRREFKEKADKHEALQSGLIETKSLYKGHNPKQKYSKIKKYFFAMPVNVYDKVKDEIPAYAGVILVDDAKRRNKHLIPWVEKKAKDLPAERGGDDVRMKMVWSCYWRMWKR